eukprot:1711013-Rhodomonas_salina.1
MGAKDGGGGRGDVAPVRIASVGTASVRGGCAEVGGEGAGSAGGRKPCLFIRSGALSSVFPGCASAPRVSAHASRSLGGACRAHAPWHNQGHVPISQGHVPISQGH